MSEARVDEIRRIPMSWEDYLAQPDLERTEWVDGEMLVMAPVRPEHGYVTFAVGRAIAAGLPEVHLGPEIGVRLARSLRGPDLVVTAERATGSWLTDPPLLVVEVLSRSTRTEDTVRKAVEYAEGGIERYWIVDPSQRSIDALVLVDGHWDLETRVDESTATATVVVGEHGTVTLDRDAVFG